MMMPEGIPSLIGMSYEMVKWKIKRRTASTNCFAKTFCTTSLITVYGTSDRIGLVDGVPRTIYFSGYGYRAYETFLSQHRILTHIFYFAYLMPDYFSGISKKQHVPLSVLRLLAYDNLNAMHSSISLSAMIYNNRFQLGLLINCTVIHIDRHTWMMGWASPGSLTCDEVH